MSTTRLALRREIDIQLRTILGASQSTRTATGGSTTTVVDTARTEADDYWNNCWLYILDTHDDAAPISEESLVTDWANATTTFTISPAFTAAVASTDTYEVRRYYSASAIHNAINAVLEELQNIWPIHAEDETLIACTDIKQYTLPSAVDDLLRVDQLIYNISDNGTATAGGNTTLTDSSKSWTTNQWAGYYVTIYDGTGKGQKKTISSNTATALTVSTWTTNPSTDSKYYILDTTESPSVVRKTLVHLIATNLRIDDALEDGQPIRLTYVPVHSDLSTDASTTSVPKVLVVDRSIYRLLALTPITLPTDELARRASTVAREKWEVSERFLLRNAPMRQARSWWGRSAAPRRTWWRGGGLSIGTKEEI